MNQLKPDEFEYKVAKKKLITKKWAAKLTCDRISDIGA